MKTLRRVVFLLLIFAVATARAGVHGSWYYGHHGHGHDGAAWLAGLAIGGLFGYLISENHYRSGYPHRHVNRRWSYYPYRDPFAHDWPRYRRYRTLAVEPSVSLVRTRPSRPAEFSHCRMTREYTTRVEVDGEMKRAYGTKCMRPDGSWELGRAKLVPEFN